MSRPIQRRNGLTDDPQEIDRKFEGIKGLVLRAEFARKRWWPGVK